MRPGGQFGQGEVGPTLTVPIVGYRGWVPDYLGRGLRSTLAPVIWDSPQATARCIRDRHIGPTRLHRLTHPHSPPGHSCSCGLYSYYELRDYYPVVGAVLNSGRIEVHGDGVRAERTRIVVLAEPTTQWRTLVRTFAEEWRIPVVPLDALEQVALEYGQPLPPSLRPQ
jgi:hypothetical protein